MNVQSLIKSYRIAASTSKTVDITGSCFWLVNATGDVQVSFDDKSPITMVSGLRFALPPGEFFKRIRFTNPDTSTAITVKFYAGDLDLSTVNPVVFLKPAPTYMLPYTYSVTKAAQTVPPITNLRTGKTVPDSLSHVIISTHVAADTSIWVENLAGTVGLVITYGFPIQLTITEQFYLRNASGSVTDPCTTRVMLFYNFDS